MSVLTGGSTYPGAGLAAGGEVAWTSPPTCKRGHLHRQLNFTFTYLMKSRTRVQRKSF